MFISCSHTNFNSCLEKQYFSEMINIGCLIPIIAGDTNSGNTATSIFSKSNSFCTISIISSAYWIFHTNHMIFNHILVILYYFVSLL